MATLSSRIWNKLLLLLQVSSYLGEGGEDGCEIFSDDLIRLFPLTHPRPSGDAIYVAHPIRSIRERFYLISDI
jgi:hypothetical protein